MLAEFSEISRFLNAAFEDETDLYSMKDLYLFGFFIHLIVFWLAALLWTLIEFQVDNFPFLKKYKVQVNTRLTWQKFMDAIPLVIFNQFFVMFPTMYSSWYLISLRGCEFYSLPSPFEFLFQLVVSVCVEEILFFYLHRFLHNRWLMRHIHSKHHSWTSPSAIATYYAHPVEHFLTNLFPIFIGNFVAGSHLFTQYVWGTLALLSSMHDHSGFHFPFQLKSPEFHDFHHVVINQNFGVLGLLDDFHGTSIMFKKTQNFKNHKILIGFDYNQTSKKREEA